MRLTYLKYSSLSTCFFYISLSIASAAEPPARDVAEERLVNIISNAEAGDWNQAKTLSDHLCSDFPKFHAARTLQKLIAQQQFPKSVAAIPISELDEEYSEHNISAELSLRIQAHQQKHDSALQPNAILKLSEEIDYALLVDLNRARLYLVQNLDGRLNIIMDYYVGIGRQGSAKQYRGDLRTPLGVYTITQELFDADLEELYGVGAWPLDYPNAWDKYMKRTGSGIWIHGVPRNTYSRPPYSSLGCVTLSNDIFINLKPYIKTGRTPAILSNNLEWVESDRQKQLLNTIIQQLEQWKNDWSSLDFDRYINHYSKQFHSEKETFNKWKNRKYATNQLKKTIQIKVENISIFNYPGEDSLIQVDFQQLYESNNFNGKAHKRQFWKLEEDNQWRIVYEGLR